MNAPESLVTWRFAGCELDQARRELRVAGEFVPLEPKQLELLLCLLHHGNAAVSKDQLLAWVWPGQILSDSVLAHKVMKLRKALKDPDQRIVATARGYGYRMAVSVEKHVAAPTLVEPPWKTDRPVPRWRAALMLSVAAVLGLAAILSWNRMGTATIPRLALLPVQVEAGAAPAWVELGLMGLLGDKLARDFDVLPASRVLARLDAATKLPVDQQVQRLRVAFGPLQVLETTLSKRADGVRIRYVLHRQNKEPLQGSIDASGPIASGERLYQRLRVALGGGSTLPSHTPLVEELYARGLAANQRGDARAARDYLTTALREDPDFMWARFELATAQRRLGELEAAEGALKELVSNSGEDPKLALSAHNALGLMHWRGGRLDQAETNLTHALALAEQHQVQSKLPSLLLNLGILHSSRGDFVQANTLYQRALAKARESGNREVEASVHNSLGVISWKQGAIDRSYAEHTRALEIRRAIDVPEDLAASLNNLATVALTRGRWTESRALLDEAHALRARLGDIAGLASTEGNLARLALLQGRLTEAEKRIRQSERHAQQAGYAKVQGEALVFYAELAEIRGESTKARTFYLAAIKYYQSIGEASHNDSLRLAVAGLPGSETQQARALAESILARDELAPLLEAEALLLYARLLASTQPKTAEQAWRRSLELADQLGLRDRAVKASLAYAEHLLGERRLDEVEPLLGRLGAWPDYAPALMMQARYWQARGDMKRALDYQRRAKDAAHEAWDVDDEMRLAALEDAFLAASH